MEIKGFPTLKIVRPGSKPGRPIVEDYNGARTAKAIVAAVVDKIPNHVKKVQDSGLDAWLQDSPSSAKAILFSDKGTTGAMIKALSVDFLGSISFAQVGKKEKAAIGKYSIKKFPTIILLPGEGKDPVSHSGEMKREALVEFFSQVASPNPDPAPKKTKSSPSSKAKSATPDATASSKFSKASEAHKSSDFGDFVQDAGTVILDENMPTESPLPIVDHAEKPMVVEDVLPEIPQLSSSDELTAACMGPKSGTCLLVLLPQSTDPVLPVSASQALGSFAEVAAKHSKRQAKIFPFYGIPADNPAAKKLREALGLKSEIEIEILALNMKRKWWRSYSGAAYDVTGVESFVDAIKLGEGAKQKLPEGILAQSAGEPVAEPSPEPIPEATPEPPASDEPASEASPEPVAEPSIVHNEL